jgi:hypothetical protein
VKKRKDYKASLDAPQATKRSRSKVPAGNFTNRGNFHSGLCIWVLTRMLLISGPQMNLTSILLAGVNTLPQSDNAVDCQEIAQPSCAIRSSPDNCLPDEPLVQGSSVAKCLFNQPLLSIPSNSSDPKTPVRPHSSPCDKSTPHLEISSSANCSNRNTSQVVTPTRCTVISSKRVTVSPNSQILYSMERSHCISASSPIKTNLKRQSRRDHVKGRLDFDVSDVATNSDKPIVGEISTSESGKEVDIFDIDFPNLDALGDFSFSEMLGDLDLGLEGVDYNCHSTLGSSIDTISGYCFSSSLLYFLFTSVDLIPLSDILLYILNEAHHLLNRWMLMRGPINLCQNIHQL